MKRVKKESEENVIVNQIIIWIIVLIVIGFIVYAIFLVKNSIDVNDAEKRLKKYGDIFRDNN